MSRASISIPDYWHKPLILLTAALSAVIGLYWDTAAGMVDIWSRSDTFAHGYLILPISLWLIWQRRAELAQIHPTSGLLALPLIVGDVAVWFIADIADINLIRQLAFVGLLPLTVWAVLGWRVVRHMIFPLAFLFLGVPMGEILIPSMMEFTARFIVASVELAGIPVYSEGLVFYLPSGTWSVVKGCSGVRYLIASVTLGVLYAYLTYQSFWKRAVFTVISAIVPIIANGIRGFIIVYLGHISDMKLAAGVDHLLYGWVFFGLVMFLLFWLGSYWQEPAPKQEVLAAEKKSYQGIASLTPWISAGLAVMLVASGPFLSQYLLQQGSAVEQLSFKAPEEKNGWRRVEPHMTEWEPMYQNEDTRLNVTYEKDGQRVGITLVYYGGINPAGELVNILNTLIVEKHPVWRKLWFETRPVALSEETVVVDQSRLESGRQRLLVWNWYWINGNNLNNDIMAKVQELKAQLLGRPKGGGVVLMYSDYDERTGPVERRMQDFLDSMWPSVEKSLQQIEAQR